MILLTMHEKKPNKLGHASIEYKPTGSILTKASGFMSGYDFTLNPYSGCSFGCTYCYAAFFARDLARQDSWGDWVIVKDNALEKLKNMRTPLEGKKIYMSSVTDPYQPIERQLEMVRGLLEVLLEKNVLLVVQTRGSLVVRDIDLLKKFGKNVQVNMTVTTDSDSVRRAFEPHCLNNKKRIEAITKICSEGIPSLITMTPLLPVENPEKFAADLAATGIKKFVAQPFHAQKGRFVASTRDNALKISNDMKWTSESYKKTLEILRANLPEVIEGQEGFAPPPFQESSLPLFEE